VVVAVRRRRALLGAVAAIDSGAAFTIAGADGLRGRARVANKYRSALRGRHWLQDRTALEPPKIPRDAIIIIMALRRHAVLDEEVVVVGQLVHETDLEHGVPRESPLDVRAVVVAAQSLFQPRREAAVRS